jgi:uncharacterized protein YgiM (DUF1202 family)
MRVVLLLIACLLLPLTAAAQEKGVALKADALLSEPFKDARKAGALNKGDAVTILKKQGGWYQVKAPTAQGWVRMLSIRRGAATSADASKELGGVASLSTGRAGTGQIVSTTGVRGLSEEELKAAKFDEKQLQKAESFRVSKADAQAFAAQGRLKARAFDNLPAPKAK